MNAPKDVSPLVVLRLASRGAPSLREIARKINVSATAISTFGIGKEPISDELLKRYAKAVGVPATEVRRRFVLSALAYHHAKVKEMRALLAAKEERKPRAGRPMRLQG